MFKNNTEYTCKHYYWDDDEREYTIGATWFFERNYPEEPDYWILLNIEVEEQEPNAPDIDDLLIKDGNIWNKIESEGVDIANATEKDYY